MQMWAAEGIHQDPILVYHLKAFLRAVIGQILGLGQSHT
jgi:hypothetical protein